MGKLATVLTFGLVVSACGSSTSPSSVIASGIVPATGTTLGGTKVTLTGTNFSPGASVIIGGAPATEVTVASATSMTATTAQHAAGAVDVVITLINGQRGSLSGAYTYIAPQPVTNTPPVISSIAVQGSVGPREPAQFASLDETVAVTATVTDAETPVSQLTYQWSSDSGGLFAGSGPRVSWTAPHTLAGTPTTAVLTLTVVEQYQSTDGNGLPVSRENTVKGSTSVRVHDSVREVGDLAVDFLVGFSKQLDPAFVVRNFTPSCAGTAGEFDDVRKDQEQNRITSYSIGNPSTTIVFTGPGGCPFRGVFGDACAQVPVEWHATSKSTGLAGIAKGTDQVTAVLEQDQWRLCASDFNSVSTSSTLSEFRSHRR